MSVYLGIDLGTSGVKTLAMNVQGEVLAEASASYPCYHPKPLWSEQDPDNWWRQACHAVRQVIEQAKLQPAEVRAIGLTGQMHGAVFLDKQDRILRPAILWNDQRTAAECDEIEQLAGGRRQLIDWVANPARTGFTAPKILWLRNHQPQHFERLRRVLLPKDDLRRRLTGEYATDYSDASGTLLLDVVHRQWSQPLLEKLQLDAELLPRLCQSDEVTGQLTPQAAAELGLSTDCLVVGGAGDCAAGAVGNGIVERGVVSTSLGTSGVLFAHSDTPEVDTEGRLHTFCHAVRDKWHLMGVTLSAAGSLDWFTRTLCQAEQASANEKPGELYERLIAEAAVTPTGAEGLFFLPYLAGERSPHADPLARGAWIGLTLAHSRGHLVRAVLEGVTFSLGDCLEVLTGLGVAVEQIRTTGGGAKSPFWRQMQANLFGRPVHALANEEGPALGAALLAAVGCGEYRDLVEATQATVRVTENHFPVSEEQEFYRRALPLYRQLYRSLKNDFRAITQLGGQ